MPSSQGRSGYLSRGSRSQVLESQSKCHLGAGVVKNQGPGQSAFCRCLARWLAEESRGLASDMLLWLDLFIKSLSLTGKEAVPLRASSIGIALVLSACTPESMGAGCGLQESFEGAVEEVAPGQNQGSSAPTSASAPSSSPSLRKPKEARGSTVDAQAASRGDETSPDVTRARTELDRPWAHNTGPANPAALRPSGSLTIETDGAVVEDLDITGEVIINANNVTLRNFRINATSWYGINVSGSGVVIEDGEIFNMLSAGILGGGYTARRLHIHDSEGDAIKSSGSVLVEYSFIEKLGRKPDSHADGNQTRGGSNITFRYNNIWMPVPGSSNYPGSPYKANANFMLQQNIDNFVIESNWLNGGGYTIYCPDGGGVYIRNNMFGRDYKYGVVTGNCAEWSGNVWEATGEPL